MIGRTCRHVDEDEALACVAGYTIINDISDRSFRPNPDRKPRERDKFFDWMHGKWHDTFCPMGPCILSADAVPDPQALPIQLTVNGEVKQDASTAEMVFPVAAVVSFISRMMTLQPGDVIATGTPVGRRLGDRHVPAARRSGRRHASIRSAHSRTRSRPRRMTISDCEAVAEWIPNSGFRMRSFPSIGVNGNPESRRLA